MPATSPRAARIALPCTTPDLLRQPRQRAARAGRAAAHRLWQLRRAGARVRVRAMGLRAALGARKPDAPASGARPRPRLQARPRGPCLLALQRLRQPRQRAHAASYRAAATDRHGTGPGADQPHCRLGRSARRQLVLGQLQPRSRQRGLHVEDGDPGTRRRRTRCAAPARRARDRQPAADARTGAALPAAALSLHRLHAGAGQQPQAGDRGHSGQPGRRRARGQRQPRPCPDPAAVSAAPGRHRHGQPDAGGAELR